MTLVTQPPPDESRTFSDVLERLGYGDAPKLSLREMVEAFGERGFGAIILMLSLMALFPWPPGGKAVFAVPIVLIAAEMALHRDEVWLPRWLLNASVARASYRRLLAAHFAAPRWFRRLALLGEFSIGFGRTARRYRFPRWVRQAVRKRPDSATTIELLRRAERLTRPRWPMLTGEAADVVVGGICILLALMMALPVPFGDALPGLTLAIFGLGIIQRDGVFIIAGLIGTAICGVYLTLVWATVVAVIHGIAHWFSALL
ncbi:MULTISPECIES: exopolysaccharide biosynthesis protein [unclassified Brevundimonas]|uniref:exopolysaccharide biosynthesis protein n=1 Tax=unclassified Brevundimonas TaxID=2622653 RepID=UPI003F91897D